MVHDPTLDTTYCVLDGVDECEEVSLEILLGKFAALFSAKTDKSSPCHLNLLIVSRGLPDLIPNLLTSFPRISLDPDASAEVNRDIDIFIEAKVEELSRHRQYPEALRVHVAKVFRDRAGSTFLWIGIVAKALRKYQITEVEKALDLFPPGLDELYARILLQIDRGRRETAARILRWVVMAVRPLALSELSFAIEPTEESRIVHIDRHRRIRDQVSSCGYFLVIKGDEVGLIHQSAKDFLLRKTLDSNPVLEKFRVKEDVANYDIAKRCLEYLQSGSIDVRNPRPKDLLRDYDHLRAFPLLLYAALEWPEHARSLSDHSFDLSLPFYHEKSQIRTSWLEAYWHAKLDHMGFYNPPKSFPLLHLASFLGILSLAEKLVLGEGWINKIKRLSFLNKVDSYRMTALMWAAKRGHDAVVRLLLEKGADTEIKNQYQEAALIIAVKHRHEAIVQLLLEKGANVDTKTPFWATPLMEAAGNGHEAIIQLLLKKGAYKEIQNSFGETALIKAVRFEQKAATQLLLKEGADIETRDFSRRTALMNAAYNGYEPVIQLLLDKGADTEAQNVDGETALMQAAKSGANTEAVIRLLLKVGADPNAPTISGDTALAVAVRSRHHDLALLLLNSGADVHDKDKDGWTALIWAARDGNEDTIQLLLDAGADTEAENKDGETARDIAARLGHEDAVRLLTPD